MYLSGFEIKTYRGDWLRELKQPGKAEEIAQFCNYWWIVASGPFVKADELPQPWGLLARDAKKGRLVKSKSAVFRKAAHPDFSFVAAILRKAQEVVTPDSALAQARKEGYEAGKKFAEEFRDPAADQLRQLRQSVKEFEEASGISISAAGWRHPKDVGRVVNQVINGTIEAERRMLVSTAKDILRDLDGAAAT